MSENKARLKGVEETNVLWYFYTTLLSQKLSNKLDRTRVSITSSAEPLMKCPWAKHWPHSCSGVITQQLRVQGCGQTVKSQSASVQMGVIPVSAWNVSCRLLIIPCFTHTHSHSNSHWHSHTLGNQHTVHNTYSPVQSPRSKRLLIKNDDWEPSLTRVTNPDLWPSTSKVSPTLI